MVSLKNNCLKRNKTDYKVTFESTFKRSQVHNVKVLSVCILTSLAVSGASALILFPPPSRERGKDHSFFKVSFSSFYPITLSSGGGGVAQAHRTGF